MNTTYFLDLLAGNVFRSKLTPALPTTLYVGLSSTEPSLNGTGFTEPGDSAYSRIELTGMGTPSNGEVANTALLSFPESVTNWGAMTYFGIFDSATGGNLLMYGELDPHRTVEEITVMSFKPGAMKLSMQNPAAATGA